MGLPGVIPLLFISGFNDPDMIANNHGGNQSILLFPLEHVFMLSSVQRGCFSSPCAMNKAAMKVCKLTSAAIEDGLRMVMERLTEPERNQQENDAAAVGSCSLLNGT